MKIGIKRSDAIEFGICESGLKVFDESFPNGITEENYGLALSIAEALDATKTDPEIQHVAFLTNLAARLARKEGKIAMNDKYQVFNPMAGTYTACISLEAAKALRRVFIEEYIQAHVGLFPVGQEEATDGGNIWHPVPEELLK